MARRARKKAASQSRLSGERDPLDPRGPVQESGSLRVMETTWVAQSNRSNCTTFLSLPVIRWSDALSRQPADLLAPSGLPDASVRGHLARGRTCTTLSAPHHIALRSQHGLLLLLLSLPHPLVRLSTLAAVTSHVVVRIFDRAAPIRNESLVSFQEGNERNRASRTAGDRNTARFSRSKRSHLCVGSRARCTG